MKEKGEKRGRGKPQGAIFNAKTTLFHPLPTEKSYLSVLSGSSSFPLPLFRHSKRGGKMDPRPRKTTFEFFFPAVVRPSGVCTSNSVGRFPPFIECSRRNIRLLVVENISFSFAVNKKYSSTFNNTYCSELFRHNIFGGRVSSSWQAHVTNKEEKWQQHPPQFTLSLPRRWFFLNRAIWHSRAGGKAKVRRAKGVVRKRRQPSRRKTLFVVMAPPLSLSSHRGWKEGGGALTDGI